MSDSVREKRGCVGYCMRAERERERERESREKESREKESEYMVFLSF